MRTRDPHRRTLPPLGLTVTLRLAACAAPSSEPGAAPRADVAPASEPPSTTVVSPSATPTPAPAPSPSLTSAPTPAPPSRPAADPWSADCSVVRCIALTFDDGPRPGVTGSVLDTLSRTGTPATFFMLGSAASAHPTLAVRVVAEGHQVGNHTQGHPDLTGLSPEGRREVSARRHTPVCPAGSRRR